MLAAVRLAVAPQWRGIPNDLPETTAEAFAAGRNWMIDQIRKIVGDVPDDPGYR